MLLDMDSISVIVPVYNCKKYIGKCIKSIQKQTYSNWKLILVDDGSTDGSAGIVEEYVEKFSNVRLIRQENSAGAMASSRLPYL